MSQLRDRVALATRASRGIGVATTRTLASAGAQVAMTRPRTRRILEVAFRPVTESSWG